MKIKGRGQLRHMFHGTYACAIAIQFASEKECDAALQVLQEGKWQKSQKLPECVLGSLNSEQLDQFKTKWQPKANPCNSFRCRNKIHEIDGLDHSIDMGPQFQIEFEVEDKDQLGLFVEKK